MKLRKFQTEICNEVFLATRSSNKRKILLMSPTGSGKTFMAQEMLKKWLLRGKRCLYTCHRRKLVNQTYNRFMSMSPSVMMGRDKRFNANSMLQIGSLYTIKNREFEAPDVIIMDEVHYGYKTKLIQGIMERFPNAIFLGMSATPIDNKGFLLEGFNHYIGKYQTQDLVEMQWLVPPIYYCPVKIDLSGVQLNYSKTDYDENELEGIVVDSKLINTGVENYIEHGDDRSFLGFAVNKKHGKLIAKAFNDARIPVGYMDSDTPSQERLNMDEQFVDGVIKGIISIEILTTGADYPHCSCIVDMSPTKILRKYLQKGGRGTRLFGDSYNESIFNNKIDFIYIDVAGQVEEHGLIEARRDFKFKPKFSEVLDQKLSIDGLDNLENKKELIATISKERYVILKKIGRLLDLYKDKFYRTESDLMDDIKNFLDKTDLFWYRQNSGVAQYGYALKGELYQFMRQMNPASSSYLDLTKFVGFINSIKQRFVRFTSVSGLADVSVFFRLGSVFIAVEAKLPRGKLTKHQAKTFPDMVSRGILLFFAMTVMDVFDAMCHLEQNVILQENGDILIKKAIYDLPDSQIEKYNKFKIPLPKHPTNHQSIKETF